MEGGREGGGGEGWREKKGGGGEGGGCIRNPMCYGGVVARCAHGSMFLGWLPNLYPVEWPP